MKKKNSEKMFIAWCESTKGLSAEEGAQKIEKMKKGFKRRWIMILTGMTALMLIMTVAAMPTMACEPAQCSQCLDSQPTN